MKKILFIFISALLLAILGFAGYQYYQRVRMRLGALQVTSMPGSKVFLDNKYLGQTPLCKCDPGDMLKTGTYTIKLIPLDSSLNEFQENVTISEGVLTVVDRTFGKNTLSEGSVISLTPLADKKSSQLLVVSFPTDSRIFLDENEIGTSPLLYNNPTESDHTVRVSKEGYADKVIRIRTPLGYKLTAAVYLSTSDTAESSAASSSAASVSAPPPSPTSTGFGSVVILDTPTGFLRVRDSSSVDSAEIARVNPGEKYPLIDQQTGWFEINLSDGRTGWISSQYAKKQ